MLNRVKVIAFVKAIVKHSVYMYIQIKVCTYIFIYIFRYFVFVDYFTILYGY